MGMRCPANVKRAHYVKRAYGRSILSSEPNVPNYHCTGLLLKQMTRNESIYSLGMSLTDLLRSGNRRPVQSLYNFDVSSPKIDSYCRNYEKKLCYCLQRRRFYILTLAAISAYLRAWSRNTRHMRTPIP